MGHRKSFDIDLFSEKNFNVEKDSLVILKLEGKILREEKGTIDPVIDGVKRIIVM